VISPTQRPLPLLLQHTTLTTDRHATGGIRTHNSSKRAAAALDSPATGIGHNYLHSPNLEAKPASLCNTINNPQSPSHWVYNRWWTSFGSAIVASLLCNMKSAPCLNQFWIKTSVLFQFSNKWSRNIVPVFTGALTYRITTGSNIPKFASTNRKYALLADTMKPRQRLSRGRRQNNCRKKRLLLSSYPSVCPTVTIRLPMGRTPPPGHKISPFEFFH